MINVELSHVFDRIADLMEITGEDKFRVNSYRRVARLLKDLTDDLPTLAVENRLTDLEGVGKGTAEKIAEYLKDGKIGILEELSAKVPAGLPDLLEVPGLGPKKVALLWKELNVASLADLKSVIDSGAMAQLPGMGETSVKRIAEGLNFLEKSGDRTPLGRAMMIADELLSAVRGMKGVGRVEIAGSLRRGCETIGDIDLLCEAEKPEKVVDAFIALPGVSRVLASGPTKGSITIVRSSGKEVQADLRVVPPESFGAAWQYFTGSKEHNVRLREMGVKRGWRLNEYGLFEGEKPIAGKTEESIYKKFGLPWIAPELRENRGEFDDPHATEKLLTLEQIRGDLHMHTTASDGKCTIEQMAEAAKARGYEYIAITDHSKSSAIANGLSIERMWEHLETIKTANKKLKGMTLLAGCECDILADGRLDYPDDLLAACDWVVASVHTAQSGGRHSPTRRTLAAIENPHVRLIGHPTGRLLGQRDAMDLDMAEIVKAAAKARTALEINANWRRLDLKDVHIRQAREAGVMLCIDTDSHHTDQLDQMRFGVITARRGGAGPEDILNTRPLKSLKGWLNQK